MALAQLGTAWVPLLERTASALSPGSPPPDGFFSAASRLLDLTVAWNAKMDLTAAKTPEELVDLLFSDAVALFACGALRPGDTWLDVGSGSGAPGLPLALLAPPLRVTLLEPMQKRVAFLRTAVGALGLGTEVVRGRSEERPARTVNVAISRATLPPPAWVVEGARLARDEVWVLLAREPVPSCPAWSVHEDIAFIWPLTGRARRLVSFRPAAP